MMSEQNERGASRSERLQHAFDALAPGLGLRLVPVEDARPRCVGIAFMVVATVPYELAESVTPLDGSADEEIYEVIQGLEALSADQYRAGEWRRFAYDPHMAVALEGLTKVDQSSVDAWLATASFREYQAEFPPKTPRDVRIHNLKIVYIGASQASASYRVVEYFENGKINGGNVSMLLGNLKDLGWRAVMVTKGGRVELAERPAEELEGALAAPVSR